jgi:hypothetical protein
LYFTRLPLGGTSTAERRIAPKSMNSRSSAPSTRASLNR